MDFKCSAEVRAKQVELEIWKLIDKGDLALMNGAYQKEIGGVCHACALGSAAMAVCGIRRRGDFDQLASYMRWSLNEKAVMTWEEAYVMEQGFEHPCLDADTRPDLSCADCKYETSPFFKLGRRLRARKRPE